MWNISDNFNTVDNVGNLNNFSAGNFQDEGGWRLTKNMALCDKSAQKYQQSFDLRNLVKKDYDIGLPNRKFNGIGFTTSDNIKHTSSIPEGLTTTEKQQYTENATFSKNITSSITVNSASYEENSDTMLNSTTSDIKTDTIFTVDNSGHLRFILMGEAPLKIYINNVLVYTKSKSGTESYTQRYVKSGSTVKIENTDRSKTYMFRTVMQISFLKVFWSIDKNNSVNNNKRNLYKNFDIVYAGRLSETVMSQLTNNVQVLRITSKSNTNFGDQFLYGVYVGDFCIKTGRGTNSPIIDISISNKDSNFCNNEPIFIVVKEDYNIGFENNISDEIQNNINYSVNNLDIKNASYNNFNITYYLNTDTTFFSNLTQEEFTSSKTLSKTAKILKTRNQTVSLPIKCNSLPLKNTTVTFLNNKSFLDMDTCTLINPKGRHYNGEANYTYFTAASPGTFKITAHTPSYDSVDCYTDYDNFITYECSVFCDVYDRSRDKSATLKNNQSWSNTLNVGDTLVMHTGPDCSYDVEWDGEYADQFAVTGSDKTTAFTEFKKSLSNSSLIDRAYGFVATSAGTLTANYTGEGKLRAYVNCSDKVKNTIPKNGVYTTDVEPGDVVVIDVVDNDFYNNNENYELYDRTGQPELNGRLTFNFTGNAVPVNSNHTFTSDEELKLILNEAKIWVDENNLQDYAFPFLIDDTGNNAEKVKQALTALNNSDLKTDLFLRTSNTIPFKTYSLQNLVSLRLNTSNQDLSSMFANHKNIKGANLTGSNIYARMFQNSSLQSLGLYNVDNKNCEYIAAGSNVSFVNIDNFSGNINSGFENCTKLFSLTFNQGSKSANAQNIASNSSVNTAELNLTSNALVCSAFNECNNLSSITVNQTGSNNDFMNFARNSSVKTAVINNADRSRLSFAFADCYNLSEITITQTGNNMSKFDNVCYNSSVSIVNLTFANNDVELTRAFYNCENLTTLNINRPDSATGTITDATEAFYNCFNLVTSHDIIKNFFKLEYNNWLNKQDGFRTAFMNCPYNGTVLDKYMSYQDQKALNFNPTDLMFNVLSKSSNAMDAGYENLHHEVKVWDNYINRHTVKVVSHQFNENSAYSYIEVDGTRLLDNNSRGTRICVLDTTTKKLKYNDWTDTHSFELKQTPLINIWNAAYEAASYKDLIIILTYDSCGFTQDVVDAAQGCGASDLLKVWTKQRYAYTFVGKKGLGKGNGFDAFGEKETFAEVSANFDNNGLICDTWTDNNPNPIFAKRSYPNSQHLSQNYVLEAPVNEFWRWNLLFKNIKSLYDSCAFNVLSDEIPNYTLSIITNGTDEQVNPNSALLFNRQYKEAGATDFIYHLAQVKNSTRTKASISGMFSGIEDIHCVECDFVDIDDISRLFSGCSSIEYVKSNMNGVTNASRAFENCSNLQSMNIVSDTITDGSYMFSGCEKLAEYDINNMTALRDATSMFDGCHSITGKFYEAKTYIPNSIEIARRMFADCGITEIEGDWLPPNSSYNMQNYTETEFSHITKDWENNLVKEDGWTFPDNLIDAYQMFAGNPITRVSFLETSKTANNSYLFQNCNQLTDYVYSFLNIDTSLENKYTGIFDGCTLSAENRIWLPASIKSNFNLKATDVATEPNHKPIEFWVDDHWCEVDDSGFIDYQHIRRKAYQDVYLKNYKDIILKYWSHIHIHSAEMRGYNEIHDAKVWYDPNSYDNTPEYYTNKFKDRTRNY